MKTVEVTIEETVAQSFDIELGDDESEACAIERAIRKYRAGELVLEPGEVQFRQIAMSGTPSREWVIF